MTSSETEKFIKTLHPHLDGATCFVGITPPFTSVGVAAQSALGTSLNIGAQNMSEYPKGAYTGEVSASMLKESGATFVLIGHSERRTHFHENDEVIGKKVKSAIQEGLLPVLCIGETQQERDQQMTHSVLTRQLDMVCKNLTEEGLKRLVVAYEPVWAIGTGKSATAQIAQETHHLIRSHTGDKWGREIGEHLPLLYGGSVKPESASALLQQEDIDGLLVGGASLEVESFGKIIEHGKE